MAKYDITYSCGHSGSVTLFGPSRDRDRKIEWYGNEAVCPDCWQAKLAKDRQRQTEEAQHWAAHEGLPPLTGSPKQIAWAERIRADKIRAMDGYSFDDIPIDEPFRADFTRVAIDLFGRIARIPESSWWIDNREMSFAPWSIIKRVVGRQEHDPKTIIRIVDNAHRDGEIIAELNAPDTKAAEIDAMTEATLRPPDPLTETVAEIRCSEKLVEVLFSERRDEFRSLLKSIGYKWKTDRWVRGLISTNGSSVDRAVELGCRLLKAGFCVRSFDPAIRERVLSANFEPEHKRWIMERTADPHRGWFSLRWPRSDDFYKAAKRIPGSRYLKPHVIVPPEQFEQVLDFAEMYGFRLSSGAERVVESARTAKDDALTCAPVDVHDGNDPCPMPGRIPPRINIPAEVSVAAEFRE